MIETSRRERPAFLAPAFLAPVFLASVTNAGEAEVALRSGADLIDCKDPKAGALGALDVSVVRDIVSVVAKRRPVSATIGDLPTDAGAMIAATSKIAETGVDIVKIGFFGDGDARAAITELGRLKTRLPVSLVAVLMADREPDLTLIPRLADHGFAGVMLDTADKSAGRLPDVLNPAGLRGFVRLAASRGLFAGLAGSLRFEDVAPLASLGPDVLGFRGALCTDGRTGNLDPLRMANLRREIDRVRAANPAPERSVA